MFQNYWNKKFSLNFNDLIKARPEVQHTLIWGPRLRHLILLILLREILQVGVLKEHRKKFSRGLTSGVRGAQTCLYPNLA